MGCCGGVDGNSGDAVDGTVVMTGDEGGKEEENGRMGEYAARQAAAAKREEG